MIFNWFLDINDKKIIFEKKDIKFFSQLQKHLDTYPTPISFSYFFNFGSLSGFCLVLQILTGFFLAMSYSNQGITAFDSIEHIMRDIPNGWLLRYLHLNGASIFFFIIYFHIGRGFYYQSYSYENRIIWITGLLIFLLMILTAFVGYVLPWGQMSFWAATVITNMLSAIPLIGKSVVFWIWGGFAVSNVTLTRFFALHFLLPFIILALVFFHIIYLHQEGSSAPFKHEYRSFINVQLPFYPYFFLKDLVGLLIVILILLFFVCYHPNYLGHSDNYITANPFVTPEHIVPEWYFLPFYAILRSIPNKLGGILAMLLAILLPLCFPFIFFLLEKILNNRKFPQFLYVKIIMFLFFICFILLGWVGSAAVEEPNIIIGFSLTILYFFLLICLLFLPFLRSYISL